MFSRFRLSGWLIAAIFALALSDMVRAESFGAAAPVVRVVQDLGGQMALMLDQALGQLLGSAAASGLPVSPSLLLGGGLALALSVVRARARRERGRSRNS